MNAGQIENVFSIDEVSRILSVLSKIPTQPRHLDIRTNGFTEKDLIFQAINRLVISKINSRSEHKIKKLTVGMQMIANEPFAIHTDFAGKPDSGYGTAYLIPLYMKGDNIKSASSTIIFNEYSTEHTDLKPYIESSPPMPEINARSIWHLVPEAQDPKKDSWAEYLSVKLIAEWKIGSLIYWDRRLYHASDNFLNKGIIEKSALVLFASDDD